MSTVLVSAGDVSGQRLAEGLVRALVERRPETRFLGLADDGLVAAGVECVASPDALAVGGVVELAPSLGRIVGTWRRMRRALHEASPALVVLVDSGGFNLPFARAVRRAGGARILYYAPPQVWAWRPKRLRRLVGRVDRIATLFPFERDFYRRAGLEVDHVGHPCLDRPMPEPADPEARRAARVAAGLDPDAILVGLYPGSRRNELARHLAIQLAAIDALRATRPDGPPIQAVIGLAPSLGRASVAAAIARSPARASPPILAGGDDLHALIDVALCKPGTVSLELMRLDRPMVVMGRVHPLTAAFVARSLRVRWLGLPNLIAEESIVPECLQAEATPDRLAAALAPLLPDAPFGASAAGARQQAGFARALGKLGGPGASARVAAIAEEMLGTDRT